MSAPVQRRQLAAVTALADYRPQPPAGEVGKHPVRRATRARVANSPAARDLRAHGWLVGLLLAVLVLLIAAGWL